MKLFVLFFSLGISILCFWFGFKIIRLYYRVKKWIVVEATIVSKKIEKHKKYSSGRSPFGLKVDYRYHYNGNYYENNTVYLIELIDGQVNLMKSNAQKAMDRLKQTTPVYVNPEAPQQSVIFCEGIVIYFLILLMGFVSLLMGLAYSI